jgi:hypothetical protein
MTGDSSKTRFGDKNNNPNHFLVLDAISKGAKDIDNLVKTTRLPREEVDLIVNDLSSQRLIIKEERKRRFFGGKKVEVKVTETGVRVLNSKKQELQEQTKQLREWHNNGNTTQLQTFMDSNRTWMPFMLFSGIMDILWLQRVEKEEQLRQIMVVLRVVVEKTAVRQEKRIMILEETLEDLTVEVLEISDVLSSGRLLKYCNIHSGY